MPKRKYTDDEMIMWITKSRSIAELFRNLGLPRASDSGVRTLFRIAKENNIDLTHFKNPWNKGFTNWDKPKKQLSESTKKNFRIIKNNSCEECGLKEWRGKPAYMEIHHIDGNPSNNSLENLQLLCLQCHAQTPSFRKRKPIGD